MISWYFSARFHGWCWHHAVSKHPKPFANQIEGFGLSQCIHARTEQSFSRILAANHPTLRKQPGIIEIGFGDAEYVSGVMEPPPLTATTRADMPGSADLQQRAATLKAPYPIDAFGSQPTSRLNRNAKCFEGLIALLRCMAFCVRQGRST